MSFILHDTEGIVGLLHCIAVLYLLIKLRIVSYIMICSCISKACETQTSALHVILDIIKEVTIQMKFKMEVEIFSKRNMSQFDKCLLKGVSGSHIFNCT